MSIKYFLVFIFRCIRMVVFFILGIYSLALILLYFFQEKLLFFPQPPYQPHYEKIENNKELTNYTINTKDGVLLDGWGRISPKNQKIIIYFGGNGDEISYFIEKTKYNHANILSFNYRGYARSQGKPSEEALFSDALEIYEFVQNHLNVKSENIYVMGRSLGSGVATYLASQKKVAGVLLITPYDSVLSVAKEGYFFVPVDLLLKNKFLSTSYAPIQTNKVLMIYGGRDYTIPNWHTEKLINAWNGSIQKVFIPDATHDDIQGFPEANKAIEKFLQ